MAAELAREMTRLSCRARIPAAAKISRSAGESLRFENPTIEKPRAAMEATPLRMDVIFPRNELFKRSPGS